MPSPSTLALPLPRLVEGRSTSAAWLTDEALFKASGLRIAFSERRGGVSSGAYEGLNLASHVGDEQEAVLENRRLLLSALACEGAELVVPRQVHGDAVLSCEDAAGLPAFRDSAGHGADALVVRGRNVAALLCFADCTPLVIASPEGGFAVVHAGWRGVMNGIAVKAARELVQGDEALLAACNVYVGPRIGACCFEVSPELAERFRARFGEACVAGERHVDMFRSLVEDLVSAGLSPERICDCGICTVCDHRFYSYRREGGVCGRHGAFACRPVEPSDEKEASK